MPRILQHYLNNDNTICNSTYAAYKGTCRIIILNIIKWHGTGQNLFLLLNRKIVSILPIGFKLV